MGEPRQPFSHVDTRSPVSRQRGRPASTLASQQLQEQVENCATNRIQHILWHGVGVMAVVCPQSFLPELEAGARDVLRFSTTWHSQDVKVDAFHQPGYQEHRFEVDYTPSNLFKRCKSCREAMRRWTDKQCQSSFVITVLVRIENGELACGHRRFCGPSKRVRKSQSLPMVAMEQEASLSIPCKRVRSERCLARKQRRESVANDTATRSDSVHAQTEPDPLWSFFKSALHGSDGFLKGP